KLGLVILRDTGQSRNTNITEAMMTIMVTTMMMTIHQNCLINNGWMRWRSFKGIRIWRKPTMSFMNEKWTTFLGY
ncbi:hypothetical protein HDU76_006503, partial [Blyttiomyces sp. JEL0837]